MPGDRAPLRCGEHSTGSLVGQDRADALASNGLGCGADGGMMLPEHGLEGAAQIAP
jgi:hypothetical protein